MPPCVVDFSFGPARGKRYTVQFVTGRPVAGHQRNMNGKTEHIPFVRPPLDRVNLVLGWGVFLISLFVYNLTRNVTVPFWDCGEFITCSYILGVPHPPGTPLYVLIARLFTFIPFISEIAGRVNFASGVFSAGTALMGYFLLARLITAWHSDTYAPQRLSIFPRLSVYAGAVSGALFLAFSSTNWGSAVEAEVYAPSMFLFLGMIWLVLVWYERRADLRSDKYLIVLGYLAILSMGIHPTIFLVVPPIGLFIALASPRLRRDWRVWMSGIVVLMAMFTVNLFLWPMAVWLLIATCGHYWPAIRRGWIALPAGLIAAGTLCAAIDGELWPILVSVFVASLAMLVIFRLDSARRSWMLAHAIVLACGLGYSNLVYIPIRSAENPAIDENDPETWDSFKGFLERKQYGTESMFTRALHRRGEWANQFGNHERMGFWGFFDRQYGYNDNAFFPFFALGLLGLAVTLRRRWKQGLMIFLLVLISSVGLVWYMNFADGTRYDRIKDDAYLEVRDRDYFWTPAFILFGAAMGLGVAALISFIGSSTDEARMPRPVRYLALGLGGVLTFLPVRTLLANYPINDRAGDYIAFDYAYNILQSADKDAVLFTNGDNDTFPVWCLQEVYGIRKDVKIANLSLINTHWYIKQLKHQLGVPVSYTDDQIDRLAHVMTPEGNIYRLQDRMIDDIMNANRWKLPINFAITVPESNRRYQMRPLEQNLKMIGMVYRVVSDTGTMMVDAEVMHEKFWNVFKFRSINDPHILHSESSERLIANYASGFLFIAEERRRQGDYAAAEREVLRAIEMLPNEWQPYVYLSQLAVDMKRTDRLVTLMEKALGSRADLDQIAAPVYRSYERLGDRAGGKAMLRQVLAANAHGTNAMKAMVRSYYQEQNYDSMYALLKTWVGDNPADTQATRMLAELQRQLGALKVDLRPANRGPDTIAGTKK